MMTVTFRVMVLLLTLTLSACQSVMPAKAPQPPAPMAEEPVPPGMPPIRPLAEDSATS